MVSASDFAKTCNTTVTWISQCTPETCCMEQGQVKYIPTLAGNALFAAIFGILLVAHALVGIRYKTWSFVVWMSLGLIGELVGYIGRIMLHNNIFSYEAFLTNFVPLTIAPAFLTASIYLCLARLIYILDPNLMYTRLKPMTYTKVFVTFDILSLILQATGGGITASSTHNKAASDRGVNIMIAGLALQVFSLVVFIGLCADFAWRLYKENISNRLKFTATSTDTNAAYALSQGTMERSPKVEPSSKIECGTSIDYKSIARSKMFRGLVCALAAATVLILIRCAYRVAELQQGFGGDLANNEVLFMVLEGPMIILACMGLIMFHPGLAMRGLWSTKNFTKAPNARELMMADTPSSQNGSQDDTTTYAR